MTDFGNKTMTVTMTVEQFDLARYALRSIAKKRLRDAEKGRHPEFAEKNLKHANAAKRVVTIINDAMKRDLGESDYLALGFEDARA